MKKLSDCLTIPTQNSFVCSFCRLLFVYWLLFFFLHKNQNALCLSYHSSGQEG